MTQAGMSEPRIVLFDGICNLCNASVAFILQHEQRPDLKFASIQSEAGRQLLEQYGFPAEYEKAIILLDHGKIYTGSTAALKIGKTLRFPWSWLASLGLIVPRFIREWVYQQVANHRYQWFGKRDRCMVPSGELKARFL